MAGEDDVNIFDYGFAGFVTMVAIIQLILRLSNTNKKETTDSSSTSSSDAVVDQLWIFPIKGCQGIRLKQARVTNSGLEGDRSFCIMECTGNNPNINKNEGTFRT